MTDNEIIKALECCMYGHECEGCSYIGKGLCSDKMKKDALDLINRQQAEIERLNIKNKALTAITKNYDWKFAKAKSEAIKEFAKRFKSEVAYCEADTDEMIWFEKNFDNLVKEMTEVQK